MSNARIEILVQGLHDPSGVGSEMDLQFDTEANTLIEVKTFGDGRVVTTETPADLVDPEVYPQDIRDLVRRAIGEED